MSDQLPDPVRAGQGDQVAGGCRSGGAAVEFDGDRTAGVQDVDGHRLFAGQHEGAVKRAVRCERSDDLRAEHAPSRGETIGPPAAKEYAVEPVGVATVTLSPHQRASTSPLTVTAIAA